MEKAIVKFNNGDGALLCNRCNTIVRQNFNLSDIEDRYYFCEEFDKTCEGNVDRDCD